MKSMSRVRFEDLSNHYSLVIEHFRKVLGDLYQEQMRFPRLFTLLTAGCHGIDHWVRVGLHGLAVAKALREQGRVVTPHAVPPGKLEEAVILAAFFHDCARISDGKELEHGREGNRVWRHYAKRKEFPANLQRFVSQAILFHVGHLSVDPGALEVTICLCNGDRLDRVRLGQEIKPELMYPDGIWQKLYPLADQLLLEVHLERVKLDMGL